ncbi:MAG: YigZ family protein [Clostridia bacterium]|nr:YigZ family protein [Clostridia bacterium]
MSSGYFTVTERAENTTVIERSKFICSISGVKDEAEAKEFIEKVRKTHSLANHNCYAYIADDKGLIQKFSDDGEPQGTAGLPMLEVLKNKKMYKTVAVVTRYFGGIKLGTGGLTRAYGGAVSDVLALAKIADMQQADILKTVLDYEGYSRLIKLLSVQDVAVIDTEFDNQVQVKFAVKSEIKDKVLSKLIDAFNGKIEVCQLSKEYYPF